MRKLTKVSLLTLVVLSSGSILAADVKANWEKHCAKCHGVDGRGQTKMGRQSGAKDYTDPKVQAEMDDAKAITRIKEGLKENGKEKMKPYAEKFSEDEMKALVAHMRSFKK